MLSITLNTELNRDNIYVSSVLPGGVRTEFTFKRKVYDHSNNKSLYNAVRSLAKMEQKGMSATQVARIIYRVATSDNPPIIVPCGMVNRILYSSSRLMPKKSLIGITKRVFRINNI